METERTLDESQTTTEESMSRKGSLKPLLAEPSIKSEEQKAEEKSDEVSDQGIDAHTDEVVR